MGKNKKEDYNLPISSYEEYLKNVDYMTLGIITYYSNFQGDNEVKGLEDVYDNFRYIYKNSLIDNKENIEQMSKNKFNTVMKNVRKLAKMDNDLVIASNSPNGIVYSINYYKMPHGYYVIIHHEILRFLLNLGNSNIIKTYVFLKYRCFNGRTKITREEIASAIGLSPKSNSSLQKISDYTFILNKSRLIKREYEYTTEINDNKEQVKKYCFYSNLDFKDFIDEYNKSKSR